MSSESIGSKAKHGQCTEAKGNIFTSYKTDGLIRFRRRWQQSWLIIQTLDPEVLTMKQHWPDEESLGDSSFCVNVRTVCGDFQYLLKEQGSTMQAPDGFKIVFRHDVLTLRQSRMCQSLWSNRSVPVSIETRLNVMERLADAYPIQFNHAIEVAQQFGADGRILAALICQGALDVRVSDSDAILVSRFHRTP